MVADLILLSGILSVHREVLLGRRVVARRSQQVEHVAGERELDVGDVFSFVERIRGGEDGGAAIVLYQVVCSPRQRQMFSKAHILSSDTQ
ncbi:plasma-membrane proton-efflux P-type ATPase [Sesbania bispinosa]|nr:plasma-membrane proton-efflux P-type ATPase [Sesbania bispinosa]